MSADVLMNLSNYLGKEDKMLGLSSILSPFRNEFWKFNNTRERILHSICHMTFKLFYNHVFGVKTSRFRQLSAMFS